MSPTSYQLLYPATILYSSLSRELCKFIILQNACQVHQRRYIFIYTHERGLNAMLNKDMIELGTKRSCIRELFEYGLKRAKEVGKENVYDYSLGNPSVPTPAKTQDSLIGLIQRDNGSSLHGYTSAAGCMPAREAVARDLNERYSANITADNIFITCGAAPALTAVVRAISGENAEVIGIAPFFPEYAVFVSQNGAKFVSVDPDLDQFQILFSDLETKLNKNTQGVIINSPNNPSGAILSKETLSRLADLLTHKSNEIGHPIYLISDEPYRELGYDGLELPYVPSFYKNTVICYSWSKSLSLPGERIGYVCIPDQVDDAKLLFAGVAGASRAAGHVCAPSSMQYMVAECISLRPDIEAYDRNRKLLYESLTSYGYRCVKPQGAFYIFVEAPGGDSQAFSDYCKEKDLLVVPGNDFCCPNYFRISTCVSYDMIVKSLPVFKERIETFK